MDGASTVSKALPFGPVTFSAEPASRDVPRLKFGPMIAPDGSIPYTVQLPKDAPRPANRLPVNLKAPGTSINSALADSVVVIVGGALGVSPGVVVRSLFMAMVPRTKKPIFDRV